MEPKYPKIEVQLTGKDGNAFSILGAVSKAMKKAKVAPEEVKAFMKEAMAGDYAQLLRTCMTWVTVS